MCYHLVSNHGNIVFIYYPNKIQVGRDKILCKVMPAQKYSYNTFSSHPQQILDKKHSPHQPVKTQGRHTLPKKTIPHQPVKTQGQPKLSVLFYNKHGVYPLDL